jgi:hypothetical protein
MSRLPELFREENPDGFNELTDDAIVQIYKENSIT